ncbi:MAG: hypothetical protein GF346_12340 [Candidatus Eisenbacteria bacterium]|nr:hypothetical protein [Candidatus Latescibacterota bacterium]MBD3303225.1 hypothetical protein [Candidatus Eisenbacteria bacterium]
MRSRILFLLPAAVALLASGPAQARPEYYEAWVDRYPDSTIPQRMLAETGSECSTCHHPPDRFLPGTCYREDIRALVNQGVPIEEALATVEYRDSDGDGVINLVEINLAREDLPDEVGYHPGLIGDLGTDPCGEDPGETITGQPETPPNPAGADEAGVALPLARATVHPNPAIGGRSVVRLRSLEDRHVAVAVFAPDGRKVRALSNGHLAHDSAEIAWDGRDEAGREVPPGVYYVRVAVSGERIRSMPLTVIR